MTKQEAIQNIQRIDQLVSNQNVRGFNLAEASALFGAIGGVATYLNNLPDNPVTLQPAPPAEPENKPK